MRTAARTLLLALTAAVFLLVSGASADTLPLGSIGMRFDALPDESCLTRDMAEGEAEELLGLSAEVALNAMRGTDSHLLVRSSDRLVTLFVAEAPEGVTAQDICELDQSGRESLLASLARLCSADNAEWLRDMPDYAMLKSASEGGMSVAGLTLGTLYLGKVYGFRLDAVGRELTDEDEDVIKSVAARALRLGAEDALAVEETAPLTDKSADMIGSGDDVRLSAASVPAIIGVNQLAISGEADPAAKLRVKVNGSASEFFYPDKDGAYSYLARRLKNGQENSIEITASKDGQSAAIRFKLMVSQQPVPLVVSPLEGISHADSITIKGATMPGAEVSAVKGKSTVNVPVDENGLFSFELNTKKVGSGYGFKVSAEYPGFKRAELAGRIRRVDMTEAQNAAERLDYKKLIDSPKRYNGQTVCMRGIIAALAYTDGTPKCLLATEDGSSYVLRCKTLEGLYEEQAIRFIGTFCGVNGSMGDDNYTYPELVLESLIDNGD